MQSSRLAIFFLFFLLVPSCARVQSPKHAAPNLPASCVAARPLDNSVWVEPQLFSYLSENYVKALLGSWGFEMVSHPQQAGNWITIKPSIHMPVTVIPSDSQQPLQVQLAPQYADRGNFLGHELCHLAARSRCHLSAGICAETINSSTEAFPGEEELLLLTSPVRVD